MSISADGYVTTPERQRHLTGGSVEIVYSVGA